MVKIRRQIDGMMTFTRYGCLLSCRVENKDIECQFITINRIYYRRYAPFNSTNIILSQIAQLPLQITNDPFAFNGSLSKNHHIDQKSQDFLM